MRSYALTVLDAHTALATESHCPSLVPVPLNLLYRHPWWTRGSPAGPHPASPVRRRRRGTRCGLGCAISFDRRGLGSSAVDAARRAVRPTALTARHDLSRAGKQSQLKERGGVAGQAAAGGGGGAGKKTGAPGVTRGGFGDRGG